MTRNQLHLALIGSGGDGVVASATMIMQTAARMGLYGIMTQSYGPQIRGGESAAYVSVSTDPIAVVGDHKDLVVCFRFSDVNPFRQEVAMAADVTLLHPKEEQADLPEVLKAKNLRRIPVPFQELLAAEGLPEIAKNVMVFGIILQALGWQKKYGEDCIKDIFSRKSDAVISANLRAFDIGYHHLKEKISLPTLSPKQVVKRELISGNELCARSAVDAGCRFFAGYPITPSSEIMETIYDLLPKVGGKLLQAEDEIAAIGMVLGASFGGVPAMTATSGPGLSLMTEMMGISSMTEIPAVIVDCQRVGPSTGIPSRAEQSDLWHALYAGHGDAPRAVLAPMDVPSCHRTMFQAFHLAETYQLPVLVLSDAIIAQSQQIIDNLETTGLPQGKRQTFQGNGGSPYLRFSLAHTNDPGWNGVSPIALPGTPGTMHTIAGIEHNEMGKISSDAKQHEIMNRKRFRKLDYLAEETASWFHIFGNPTAKHRVVAWGSVASVLERYVTTHKDMALFVPEILSPFPIAALQDFLAGARRSSIVEQNFQGQLYHYLRSLGTIDGKTEKICRSGGLAFSNDELDRLFQEGGA